MFDFEPTIRVDLERQTEGVSPQILAEIQKIEAKAKPIRKAGRAPHTELSKDVDDLRGRIFLFNQQVADAHKAELTEAKDRYQRDRDRNPSAEMARYKRAESKINAINNITGKDGVNDLENFVLSQGENISFEESQILTSKLRGSVVESVLKETISKNKINEPWLSTPELKGLQDKADKYSSLGTNILSENYEIDVEHLIDFNGRMEEPA